MALARALCAGLLAAASLIAPQDEDDEPTHLALGRDYTGLREVHEHGLV